VAGSRLAIQLAHADSGNTPVDADRRMLLGRGLAAFAALGAVGGGVVGVRQVLAPVRVQPLRVALKRLPPGMSGLTIAQLSDIHVGPTIGRGFIEEIVRRTNALDPDVVVITGDLVDGPLDILRDQIAPLAELKSKLGVYFVTGNHEYFSGVE